MSAAVKDSSPLSKPKRIELAKPNQVPHSAPEFTVLATPLGISFLDSKAPTVIPDSPPRTMAPNLASELGPSP